jgi:hypothetical protein
MMVTLQVMKEQLACFTLVWILGICRKLMSGGILILIPGRPRL